MNERLRALGNLFGLGKRPRRAFTGMPEEIPIHSQLKTDSRENASKGEGYPGLSFVINDTGKKINCQIFHLDETDKDRKNLFETVGKKPGMYLMLEAVEGDVNQQELINNINSALMVYITNLTFNSKRIHNGSYSLAAEGIGGKVVVARLDISHLKSSID